MNRGEGISLIWGIGHNVFNLHFFTILSHWYCRGKIKVVRKYLNFSAAWADSMYPMEILLNPEEKAKLLFRSFRTGK